MKADHSVGKAHNSLFDTVFRHVNPLLGAGQNQNFIRGTADTPFLHQVRYRFPQSSESFGGRVLEHLMIRLPDQFFLNAPEGLDRIGLNGGYACRKGYDIIAVGHHQKVPQERIISTFGYPAEELGIEGRLKLAVGLKKQGFFPLPCLRILPIYVCVNKNNSPAGYASISALTSSRRGMAGMAPFLVVARDPTALAKFTASCSSSKVRS